MHLMESDVKLDTWGRRATRAFVPVWRATSQHDAVDWAQSYLACTSSESLKLHC
jgi:hypothetical protein